MVNKERIAVVVSNKMDKTVTVIVQKLTTHKKYGKIINITNKYYVDDPMNSCNIGDKIRIKETRPISKNKRWKMIEIIEKI